MIPAGPNVERALVAAIAVYLAAWFVLVALAVLYAPQWVVAAVLVAAFVVTGWLGVRMTVDGEGGR